MAWPRSGGAFDGSFTCTRSGPEGRPQIHKEDDMSKKGEQMSISRTRRAVLGAMAAAGGLSVVGGVQAQGEDIVIGGSIPMSGVFAFAGIGIHAGIQDYVKIV